MGILDGLLGGGGGDPYDVYGDLFTDKQKAALRDQQMTQGLLQAAAVFSKAGQASRLPVSIPWGEAAAALGGGQDAAMERMLKGMQVAETVRAAKQKRELAGKVIPFFWKVAGGDIVQSPSDTPPAPGAVPLGPAPAAATPPSSTTPVPTSAEWSALPNIANIAGPGPSMGLPPPGLSPFGLPDVPPAMPMPPAPPGGRITPADYGVPNPPGAQQTGLGGPMTGPLAAAGPPDQVIGQGPGLLERMQLAALQQQGGSGSETPPFRLASLATPGAATPGAGGDDVLDTVIAPLESGNRNIHQAVVSPSVSTAQGYYQITNSTWRDTAPKAGVDLDKYPTAMSAPREVQKAVAEQLRSERGLQPWADFNPAVAAATGYRRGGRFAGMGPAAAPGASSAPDGGSSALAGLLSLVSGPGSEGLSPPDIVLPSDSGDADRPAVRLASAALAPYATGNAVLGGSSSVEGVGDALSNRILEATKAMPPEVRERFKIISGYRDAARQREVNPGVTYSQHGSGTGPSGTGRAVDLAKDPAVLDWITKNPQYGIGFPLASDPREINHLEMIDPASGARLAQAGERRVNVRPLAGEAVPAGTTAPGGGKIPGLNMTPQQLGAFNALFEMSGLGDPFKSLLETYYKSPGYLGEKATAETKARTAVEDPLNQRMEILKFNLQMRKDGFIVGDDGKVTEDPEWAKIHQRRTDETESLKAKYQEQVQTRVKDHEEKIAIGAEQRADQREIVQAHVYGPGGQVIMQEMPRGERIERLKNQTMNPGPYKPGDIIAKPVGDPPPEHQWQMTPQGELKAAPVPGSPAATKAAEVTRTQAIADRTLLRARDIMNEDTARIEQTMKSSLLPVTGFWGSLLSASPGTPQHDVAVAIKAIQARTSLDSINATRSASGSTGLGQITMGEHTMLASAVAALTQSQTKEAFLLNLRRVNAEYNNLISSPVFRGTMPKETTVVPPQAPSGLPPGYTDTGRRYQGKPIVRGPDGNEGTMKD